MSSEFRWLLPWAWRGQGMKMTIHLHSEWLELNLISSTCLHGLINYARLQLYTITHHVNHHIFPWIIIRQWEMQHNIIGHSGVIRWNRFPFWKLFKQSLIMDRDSSWKFGNPFCLDMADCIPYTIKHVTMHVMIQQRHFYPTMLISQILIQCIRQRDSLK